MLPSGNDAAIALGEWGGKVIKRFSGILKRMRVPDSFDKTEKAFSFLATFTNNKKTNLRLFIHHMNKLSKHLELKNTHFANTHGLMN